MILRAPRPAGLALAPEQLHATCLALIDTFAELHAIDYAAAGLSEIGKPAGYTARQVAG